MEHHANIVPWQMICEERGAVLKVIPVNEQGELILEEYYKLLSERTKFVSVVYVSNSIGTINPVKEIINAAHERGIPVLIDGCQAAPHMVVDLQELDCDFFVFSGHKIFAPTGIGILYGKEKYLEDMPPYQTGGDMIRTVTFQKTTFNDLPYKFEAGTPHIEGSIGLAAAIEYLQSVGRPRIHEYENQLVAYATEKIKAIDGLRIIGNAKEKIPVFSFVVEGAHPLDIGTMLDFEGVAIRTGNHCTQPLVNHFGVSATCRASLAFYNTTYEIDNFVEALQKVLKKIR
jgi:cysteine desulfurase/selenocysteine lyase